MTAPPLITSERPRSRAPTRARDSIARAYLPLPVSNCEHWPLAPRRTEARPARLTIGHCRQVAARERTSATRAYRGRAYRG